MKGVRVNFKKLREDGKMPTRGSDYAAGYDLYASLTCSDRTLTIPPHQTIKVGTGIAMEIPEMFFGGIFARSGLSTKEYLRPANCVGIVDSDYRGEVIVALHNDSDTDRVITNGDRIAQFLLLPVILIDFYETDKLSSTDRDDKGFGSSGKK